MSASIQKRVVLRLTDEQGYGMLDEPKDILSATSAPGRAIVGGRETQIAVVGGTANVAEQSAATIALGEAIGRSGRAPAMPIGSLPQEIEPSTMPADLGGAPVLGVSDDTLAPVSFDPTGVFVLAGPPASGRTSALAWLVESIRRAEPNAQFHYFGSPRSVLAGLPGWTSSARTVEEVSEQARALAATLESSPESPRIVAVIEGISDFLSGPADPALVDLIKAVKRSNHFLIAESETTAWASSWPLLAEVKSARTGFLLQPETMDGELILRTALPRVARADFPPGRGFLIARGKTSRVQLPFVAT